MKKLILILTYLLSTVALLTQPQVSVAAEQTTVAGSNLELNGVGVHSELRKEWFLNALYLTSKTDDAEDAVSSTGVKRMELRVLADNLSGRRLKRFWIERIKNNNEASSVLSNAKSVRDFANLMDNDLVTGDIVTIDALPSATVVSINGSEVGRTDAAAFPLILRTWVGDRPPSSEFKDAILGDVSNVQRSELITRLNTVQPSQARIAMFDKAAVQAREEEERKKREEEERKKREEEESKKQEELKRLQEQQKLEEEQKALAEQAQKAEEVAEAERLRRELEEARRQLAEQQAAAEAAAGPTAAEIAAMRAKYSDQLGAHYVPYFEYPQRDILRRHGKSALMRPRKGKTHGDVSISIEVDREGDLVGGALVSSSGEKILDDAVMNALFDSVPFPGMPEDLPGETFKTTVSISIPAPQM